jgi:EAL domain-containing protein (putative c-di-GMP-specific phosphodiesterase class I)
MVDEDDNTLRALRELHEAGIYLAVDDFGTGYSSLSYLTNFPIDELKLDRSFILDAERSEKGARLITAIIAMARSLDLGLLVEGVENEEQLRTLSSQGAGVMQGYLFSEAVPAGELRAMLAPWHFMAGIQKSLYQGEAR